jgi:hypothetical protein
MMNNGYFIKQLVPDAIVGGCINIFENAWSTPQNTIDSIEELCKDAESGIHWNRATTIGDTGGVISDMRTNFDLGITQFLSVVPHEALVDTHNQMHNLVNSAVTSYCTRYGIQEPFWHEAYNMLKYSTGHEYKPHYDGNTAGNRHISCIVYLNDEYEGGELEFPNFNVKIKPQKGMLVVFPSNFAYTHIAKPVTSGTKYAIVTWLHDCPENL